MKLRIHTISWTPDTPRTFHSGVPLYLWGHTQAEQAGHYSWDYIQGHPGVTHSKRQQQVSTWCMVD
jgi:hypothetical protein